MDRRRAAGALLALAACIACSAAAPTASNHTALDLYDGAPEGCYYNFQHYGEGDRIMTNEPCLNCTCHNRMLMCYLRVCPFTKPIGQDCTVEKRADQCCPIVTCPDVPVDLLTSTSTSSPAEYGATGLGKLDKYGCSINGKYFPEGSKVPPTPNKPCEHCYCIRNMTTCVMQECTLHVDGCTPIYHKDVCCPVRYSCDHPEDEMPLLDDMSTTVRPTPGFLLTTTTVSPVTQMTQDCVHNDQVIADGASITTEKACEHCYCMKGDIVCVVQECGAPMENEGKNCTSLPPREGQCCPDTYICEGDELSTEIFTESSTDSLLEKLTTLSPPRRSGVEGSGYRNEPSEGVYTEMPTAETEFEGSGEDEEPTKPTDGYEPLLPGKPLEPGKITPALEDGDQYIPVTTKAPTFEEHETTTKEIEKVSISDGNLEQESIEPQTYTPTTHAPTEEQEDKLVEAVTEDENLKLQEHITVTNPPESYEKVTTESGDSLTLVPDSVPVQEHDKPHEYIPITTPAPVIEDTGSTVSEEGEPIKDTSSVSEPEITQSPISEETPASEYATTSYAISEDTDKETTEQSAVELEHVTEKDGSVTESYTGGTTSAVVIEEVGTVTPKESEEVTFAEILKDKETSKPVEYIPSTTSVPEDELTTEPDHAQNTVAVAEDGYPHITSSDETEKSPTIDVAGSVTEKSIDDSLEHTSTQSSVSAEIQTITSEPDKGLNTIPSEIDEESTLQPSLVERTTLSVEVKSTESSVTMHVTQSQDSDDKASTTESSVPSEAHITKADQYTITTEPSFRREDEIRVTTEKPKEDIATTIKAEFVDEGLIPTSTHDEKLSTGSDVSTDEEITTMSPEYSQGLDETVDSKHPTTETIVDIPVVSEKLPEKPADTVSEQEGETLSSTEKPAPALDIGAHEEPSRIPGEGDCLLNGVTYRNNTIVPSTNNCHTGCKCVSSIIKCDPIICSPPPDYMDNCQSIYDTPDSCCPTYVCDHPKETIPPQSDNQMSGTEPPVPPPVIECRGDQCELSEPTKESSEPCTSDTCVPTKDKAESSDCGPEGCEGVIKEPQPSVEEPSCADGKCQPPSESCAQGECKVPSTEDQISPIKPCEGDNCKEAGEKIVSPQHCENEGDCKKQQIPVTQTVPCEGDACTSVDCGSGGCAPDTVLPPQEIQPLPCKGEDGCKPQEIVPSDCIGDVPCRRKDTPTEELPSQCSDGNCVEKTTDTIETQQTPVAEVTEKIEHHEEEKLSEPTESQVPQHETTPITEYVTEIEHRPTEHPEYETTESEIKTDDVTQKIAEVQDISTIQPSFIEEKSTKTPVFTKEDGTEKTTKEQGTEKPITSNEDGEKPSVIQEEEVTKTPESVDKDQPSEEKRTEKPGVILEEHTDIPALIEDEGTKAPEFEVEEHTDKPSLTEEEDTKIPDIETEQQTRKPVIVEEEEGTKMPDLTIEEQTGKPDFVVDDGTKIPDLDVTGKPIVEEDGTSITDTVVEEHTDKTIPTEEQDMRKTDTPAEYTSKPAEETGTKLPDVIIEEHTTQAVTVEDAFTKIPDGTTDEHTPKPALSVEGSTKIPQLDLEEQTNKPSIVEEDNTKMPDTIVPEHADKTVPSEEESTKTSDLAEGYTDEPTMLEETGTKIPAVVIEEQTGKPADVEEQGTVIPEIIKEDHTDKSKEEGTKIADVSEGYTDEPTVIEETGTKIPKIEEDGKTPEEESTKLPDIIEVQSSDKTPVAEEHGTKAPETVVEEQTTKPSIEEEHTKIPDTVIEEQTDKSVPTQEQDTKLTDAAEGYTDKPALAEETATKLSTDITEEGTGQPTMVDSKIPSGEIEIQTDKPGSHEEEDLEVPDLTAEDQTRKPPLVEAQATKIPDIISEEQTGKPAIEEEYLTKIPEVALEEHTDKSTDQDDTTISGIPIEEEKPGLEEEQSSIKPDIGVEQQTDKIGLIEDESTKGISEEEHTDKPLLTEDESTKKPDSATDLQGEEKEKPILIEHEPEKKPEIIEEEGITDHSILDGEGTEMPEITEVSDTKKPMIIDESTLAPAEIEYGTETKSPITIDEASTDKPVVIDDKQDTSAMIEEATKEPAMITSPHLVEKEYTEGPEVHTEAPKPGEEHEHIPQPPKDEGTRRTDSHKEDKLPESSVEEHAEVSEQPTETPIDEIQSQTVAPESKPSEPQESGTLVPDIETHNIVTESLMEQEKATMVPPTQPISEQHEHITTSEYSATTESEDKISKSTEHEAITEKAETYTDMPEQESSATKSPIDVIIEPQDGEQPVSPDVTVKAPGEEESATTVYEKEPAKPVIPETHVTDNISDYAATTAALEPEIIKATESPKPFETETQQTELPQDIKTEKVPQKSDEVGGQEIKTGQPEIFTPEKEEMMTSTSSSLTTEPVKGFTEIEDAFVTGQGEITTESHAEPIDGQEPSVTEKPLSSETPMFDTKVTAAPEESYTESHELHTEEPVLRETEPADIYAPHEPHIDSSVEVTTKSIELSEKTTEPSFLVTGNLEISTEPSEIKQPDTSVETKPQEKPIGPTEGISGQEGTITKSPESDISVTDLPVTENIADLEVPESHVATTVETEQSKPIESSDVEENVTDNQESGEKDEEPTLEDTRRTTIPESSVTPEGTQAPEIQHTESHDLGMKEQPVEVQKASTEYPVAIEESHTELPHAQVPTDASLSLVTEPHPGTTIVEDMVTDKHDTEPTLHETYTESQERTTVKSDVVTVLPEVTTVTPYLIELEEHTHKIVDDISTTSRTTEDHTYKAVEDTASTLSSEEEHTHKTVQDITTAFPTEDEQTFKIPEHLATTLSSIDDIQKTAEYTSTTETRRLNTEEVTEKITEGEIETATKEISESSDGLSTMAGHVSDQTTVASIIPEEASEKLFESSVTTEPAHIDETTIAHDYQKEVTSAKTPQSSESETPITIDTEKSPISDSDIVVPTEKESPATQEPLHTDHVASQTTTVPEDELILSTTKATTTKQEEMLTPVHEDKYEKPEEKPASEIIPPSTTAEIPKPSAEMQPTDEISPPEDDGHFPPSGTGYGEPDYVEEDQAFGPGTCRYGGKVYVSAQQIPRDDPCDFCFCFRSDIICLQQSCPPPIHGCHEEPIQGFCCPRYECPVSMATTVNVTTTTTTTTTTLPPHFPTHSYKGAAQRRGCQIKGHTYKVGEVVRSSSGPCLHCTCGGDGQMKCDPKACTPEPMLRQMIAAAVSAKRRR